MTLRRHVLISLACALALAIPGSGVADHGATCGETWSGSGSCLFYFRGLPITIEGSAFRSSGQAEVRVRVTIAGDTSAVLMSCEDSGRGEASCRDELGTGHLLDSTKQLVLLECRVDGVGSGEYGCKSALGF